MTVETRLAAVATKLTVFERARLALRSDFAGEMLDADMRRVLKPEEPECRRIIEAVHEANQGFYQACSYLVEWLYQEEIQLGWLRCLDAMLARDATLCEGLAAAGWSVSEGNEPVIDRRAKAVVLTALPEPDHGLERTLPLMWGTKAYPDNDDTKPEDLETLRDQLAFELRRTVELRWRDLLAHRAILAEIGDLFGEPMVHIMLATPLDLIEAKVLELYEELCRRGERFPLPGRDEERIALYRDWVRWDDMRAPETPGQPSTTQRWMTPQMQEQMDALEGRLAAELRGGNAGEAK